MEGNGIRALLDAHDREINGPEGLRRRLHRHSNLIQGAMSAAEEVGDQLDRDREINKERRAELREEIADLRGEVAARRDAVRDARWKTAAIIGSPILSAVLALIVALLAK